MLCGAILLGMNEWFKAKLLSSLVGSYLQRPPGANPVLAVFNNELFEFDPFKMSWTRLGRCMGSGSECVFGTAI